MKNKLYTDRLLKNSLLVIFLLASGTAFSQTARNAGKNLLTEKNSEVFAKIASDIKIDQKTEITLLAAPVNPVKKAAEKESPEGPPQWVKDLRRGEIIAFGSLPFTFFFTQTFMDLYRTATHNWDNRYAPSVFKGPGAIPMTDAELKMMFGITISASVLVAVADHIIVRYKRNKARSMSDL